MPTYEFRCKGCGEEKQTVSPVVLERVSLPTCTCGKTMRRVFSPPAVIFKGGGFYSTSSK